MTRLTFSVMSSEQEASRFPVGSHLIAFTSFWSERGGGGGGVEGEGEALLVLYKQNILSVPVKV